MPQGLTVEDVNNSAGFVYIIERIDTGRAYIGRKYTRKRYHGKIKPSGWERYWGSCKPLTEEIAVIGHSGFRRTIISLHKTQPGTNYAEVEEQFGRDVLKATLADGSRAFYNGNIMARWFCVRDASPQTRRKMSLSAKARTAPRPGMSGQKHTSEARAKMSAVRTGKVRSPETIAKMLATRSVSQDYLNSRQDIATQARLRSRLTLDDLMEIKASKDTTAALVKRFDISQTHMRRVRSNIDEIIRLRIEAEASR